MVASDPASPKSQLSAKRSSNKSPSPEDTATLHNAEHWARLAEVSTLHKITCEL
jgi:hypothetical protein